MGSRARLGSWHFRFALAALAALLLRAWIPAGFMPASDGSLSLVLCPGTAPLLASAAHRAPPGHHHHEGQGEKAPGMPCPFAVASAAAGPPQPPTLAPPAIAFAAPVAPPRAARLSPDVPHLLPPATGPPARL